MAKLISFGFEIEGEFDNTLAAVLKKTGNLVGDGSIRRCCEDSYGDCEHDSDYNCECCDNLYLAEFVSKPFRINQIRKALDIFKLIGKYDFHHNKSCGFHIHLRFDPMKLPEVISRQFNDYYIKMMGKRWPELVANREDNEYCRLNKSDRDIISTLKGGSRYRAINYDSLRKHGTVEIRLLPSAHPAEMARMLIDTLMIARKWIARKQLMQKFELDLIGRTESEKVIKIATNNILLKPVFRLKTNNRKLEIKL